MPPAPTFGSLEVDLEKERAMASELEEIFRSLRAEMHPAGQNALGGGGGVAAQAFGRVSPARGVQPAAAAGRHTTLPGFALSPTTTPLPLSTPPLPHRLTRDVLLLPAQPPATTAAPATEPISSAAPSADSHELSPPSPLASPSSRPQPKWNPAPPHSPVSMPHVPSPHDSVASSPARGPRSASGPGFGSFQALQAAAAAAAARHPSPTPASLTSTPLRVSPTASVTTPRSPHSTSHAARSAPRTPRSPVVSAQQENTAHAAAPANAEPETSPRANAKAPLPADVFAPLRTLGPFAAAMLEEVTAAATAEASAGESRRSSGGGGGRGNCAALSRYRDATHAYLAGLRENFAALLSSHGIQTASFLPQCYARQAAVLRCDVPFRIAVTGAEDAGVAYLVRAVVDQVMESLVFPHHERSDVFVLPLDWALVLPPSHRGVELGNFFCRFVQRMVDCLVVFKPWLRGQGAVLSTFLKRVAQQHVLPAVPEVLARSGQTEGVKALCARLQESYHEGRIVDFTRAMFVLPHVIADALGMAHVVLVYRRMELLEGATFVAGGKRVVEDSVVISSVMHAMSVCNASVVVSLTHRSNIELSHAWTTLSTEFLALPEDLHLVGVPDSDVDVALHATRGCPAYLDILLTAQKNVEAAVHHTAVSDPAADDEQMQLLFLRDAASAVMGKIAALSQRLSSHMIREKVKQWPGQRDGTQESVLE